MHGTVTSIVMVRDSFYTQPGTPGTFGMGGLSEVRPTPDTARMLKEDATYNVGDAEGEVPAWIAVSLLNASEAAPYTVDGELFDKRKVETI